MVGLLLSDERVAALSHYVTQLSQVNIPRPFSIFQPPEDLPENLGLAHNKEADNTGEVVAVFSKPDDATSPQLAGQEPYSSIIAVSVPGARKQKEN
ncbi:hypothetical protein AAHC03_04540 [Spirometra sp. Aus1]